MNIQFTDLINKDIKYTSTLWNKAEDPPLRYWLVGKKIGLPTLRLYLRALAGLPTWAIGPLILARLLGKLQRKEAVHRLQHGWSRGVKNHLRLRLDLEGLEYIDPREAYIIVSLHEGFADVIALLHLPLKMRFVARDEFLSWPLLGPFLRDTGQILINPEENVRSYRRLQHAAPAVFAARESLIIFPQGTILGIETDFLKGAFALAFSTHRPLLPVALSGSHRIWEYPYTSRLRYSQRLSMRVLPAVPAEEYLQSTIDEVRITIQRRLKAEALSGTMAAPRHFVPARDGYWDEFAYQIDPDFPELAADVARHRHTIKDVMEKNVEANRADRSR